MSKSMLERIWVGTNAYAYSKAHTVGPHTVMRGKAKYILASKYAALEAERDTLKEQLQAVGDIHRAVMSETCPTDEFHCTCVPVLRSEIAKLTAERDELKQQIAHLDLVNGHCECVEALNAEISRLRSSLRGKVDAEKLADWTDKVFGREYAHRLQDEAEYITADRVESLLRYIAERAGRREKPSNERARESCRGQS